MGWEHLGISESFRARSRRQRCWMGVAPSGAPVDPTNGAHLRSTGWLPLSARFFGPLTTVLMELRSVLPIVRRSHRVPARAGRECDPSLSSGSEHRAEIGADSHVGVGRGLELAPWPSGRSRSSTESAPAQSRSDRTKLCLTVVGFAAASTRRAGIVRGTTTHNRSGRCRGGRLLRLQRHDDPRSRGARSTARDHRPVQPAPRLDNEAHCGRSNEAPARRVVLGQAIMNRSAQASLVSSRPVTVQFSAGRCCRDVGCHRGAGSSTPTLPDPQPRWWSSSVTVELTTLSVGPEVHLPYGPNGWPVPRDRSVVAPCWPRTALRSPVDVVAARPVRGCDPMTLRRVFRLAALRCALRRPPCAARRSCRAADESGVRVG